MSNEITNEWLESLAFFHARGTPESYLTIHTNGDTLETFDDGYKRQWWLNGARVNPLPISRRDVKNLLERLRRDGR